MKIEGYHSCVASVKSLAKQYGPSVNYCYEDDMDLLWAENGEYESQVNYCPFCGYEAKVKIVS